MQQESFIGGRRQTIENANGKIQDIFTKNYSPSDSAISHIEFSLKYDYLNLDLLEQVFTAMQKSQDISREEAEARAARPIPLQRINEPEDIAAMAVFLASPGARNITGQAYNVDGGLILS